MLVNPAVRERYAFSYATSERPRSTLEVAFPGAGLRRPSRRCGGRPIEEPDPRTVYGRAALFRAAMAALPDWADTLAVTHWGFIMSLTGQTVANGQWLRCDLVAPPPAVIPWKHH